MITVAQCAYMAGLIDGEGSILMWNDASMKRRVPKVCITTTTLELLEWIPGFWGGSVKEKAVCKPAKENWAKAYEWIITGKSAIQVIKDVAPYLRHKGKIERARLILEEYKPIHQKLSSEVDKIKAAEFEIKFMGLSSLNRKYKHSQLVLKYFPSIL